MIYYNVRITLCFIEHIGGKSPKAEAIKKQIREQFKNNKDEKDPETIEKLREDAFMVRYIIYIYI